MSSGWIRSEVATCRSAEELRRQFGPGLDSRRVMDMSAEEPDEPTKATDPLRRFPIVKPASSLRVPVVKPPGFKMPVLRPPSALVNLGRSVDTVMVDSLARSGVTNTVAESIKRMQPSPLGGFLMSASAAVMRPSVVSALADSHASIKRITDSHLSGAWRSALYSTKGLDETGAGRPAIFDLSQIIQTSNMRLVNLSRVDWQLQRPVAESTGLWTRVVIETTARPADDEQVGLLDSATQASAAISVAGVSTAQADADAADPVAAEAVLGVHGDLLVRLGDIHEDLPAKWDGAWHAVGSAGPAAGSQAANSAIETLDWTMRQVAPDEAVLEGLKDRGLKPELDTGKASRREKLEYLTQTHSMPRIAQDYIGCTVRMIGVLQGSKHRIDDLGVDKARVLLIATQASLAFLLLDQPKK